MESVDFTSDANPAASTRNGTSTTLGDLLEAAIPARFMSMVAAYPDRQAVSSSEGSATYRALEVASRRVMAFAHDECGTRSEPVAVIMPQGILAVTAILGVLRAGKYYVPLDPDSPLDWARRVLDQVTPRLILTDFRTVRYARSVAPAGTWVHSVENVIGMAFEQRGNSNVSGRPSGDTGSAGSPSPPFEESSDALPGLDVRPSALSYVYFTSGTTGSPKGVMDNHRNVLHNIMRYTNALSITPRDRLSLLQPIGFSGSVSSMFSALLNGACVCPVDMSRETAASLSEWIHTQQITIYHSVPSIFRTIADGKNEYPSVRVVRLEGDRASFRDVDRFLRSFSPGSVLANGLGMTEAGIVSQFFVDHQTEIGGETLPVGTPCQDMNLTVVDAEGRPVAPGVEGEICVSSLYLALGYWNRPRLTTEKFKVVADEEGVRRYRSGDLGRFTPDGLLEHLGRLDGRLKIRGQWVEPASVEEALVRIPAILEAAVVRLPRRIPEVANVLHEANKTVSGGSLRADEIGQDSNAGSSLAAGGDGFSAAVGIQAVSELDIVDSSGAGDDDFLPHKPTAVSSDSEFDQLVAYIVIDGMPPSVPEIRRELGAHLPSQAIPTRFVVLNALPVTRNGKIDRSALPRPGRDRPHLNAYAVPPKGSLQLRLVEIWSEMLEVDGLGVHDDFFDVGGDSLLALEMLDRIEHYLGRRLPADTLLRGATIEDLADALIGEESELREPVVALQTEGDGTPLFFFHGDYVSGGFYALELARRFGADRPFYGVRPCGLDGEAVPGSYAAMAERHVAEITGVQPRGPYLLGGLCNGGLVAYEVARLLERRGERVDLLLMIDASAANLRFERLCRWVGRLRIIGLSEGSRAWLFGKMRAVAILLSETGLLHSLGVVLSRTWNKLKLAALDREPEDVPEGGSDGDELPSTVAGHWSCYRGTYQRIDHRYFPRPYDGRAVLLWPDEKQVETIETAESYWKRVCPQIDVRSTPGDVLSCHTRFAGQLAAAMRNAIDDYLNDPPRSKSRSGKTAKA